MLKLVRRGAMAGLLAAGAYAAWRFLASRAPDTNGVMFETTTFPGPPRPIPQPAAPTPSTALIATPETNASAEHNGSSADPSWVEPDDGSCPLTHPIKAKLSSGIYHEPGGGNYDRIRAERCYVDPDAAIADGLRAPKR